MTLRAFQLLGIAAEAEGLRLKLQAKASIRSAVIMAVAGVFGIAALTLLHVAGFIALRDLYGSLYACLGVALADLLLMGVLLLMGRSRKDPVAEAALLVRRTSLTEAARAPLLGDLMGMVGLRSPVSLAGGLVAERIVRALKRR
ncbi:MAG: phage holin family protein [Rubritepida sp.]|nr:phage holin family protein [Rubritepida sp.]